MARGTPLTKKRDHQLLLKLRYIMAVSWIYCLNMQQPNQELERHELDTSGSLAVLRNRMVPFARKNHGLLTDKPRGPPDYNENQYPPPSPRQEQGNNVATSLHQDAEQQTRKHLQSRTSRLGSRSRGRKFPPLQGDGTPVPPGRPTGPDHPEGNQTNTGHLTAAGHSTRRHHSSTPGQGGRAHPRPRAKGKVSGPHQHP